MKRPLLLITLGILFFITPKGMGQTSVTRIYTDWNGYWTSNSTSTNVANQPNNENNLLAFSWNGKTYATGANNAALTANSVSFENSRFRALKIQSLPSDASSYYLQGSNIDGSLTNRILTPPISGSVSTPAELASRLTDGINGLALGTGIANIKSGISAEFKVGTNNIQLGVIGDGIPDIIVSQVAQPNSVIDNFKFVNASGVIIGNAVNVDFSSIPAMATYRLDLFNTNNGTPATGFNANDTRDIRLLAIDLNSFGITDATASQVDRFIVTFSGSSDCAFIAFNTNSLKLAQLRLVKKGTLTGCGKLGDIINYTFEVTNTGDVPITNINVTDLMPGVTITGNPVSSLAVGAKTTLTGTYTITAADVAAGRVVNSAKVTGLDPSLNIVEDLSGDSSVNDNDIATVTNLLTPPSVGTITNVTCSALGSVVLSNLPSGNWSLQTTPGGTTSGSGTTTTISGLTANTYTFKVTATDFGCTSPSSANAIVTDASSTTWNGTSWSNGDPDARKNAIIAATDYIFPAGFRACALTINGGVVATVPSGVTINITNAVTVNNASGAKLIFENNSSLVQDQTTTVNINSGSIVYKRISSPMKNFDFSYWSSPVSGQNLLNLSPNTLSDKYFSYTGSGWKQEVASTTSMAAGIGYIIRVPKPNFWPIPTASSYVQPVQFIGKPNNGDITGQAVTTGKFYLIGNPYPSALDADKFLYGNTNNKNILNGTIYFWTHNTAIKKVGTQNIYVSDDYASYNGTGGTATSGAASGGSAPTGYIAAGQSFFGSAKAAGTIQFKNNMRTAANNSQFFKPGKTAKTEEFEKNRLWLNMTNSEGAFKQTLIGYVTGATNEFDGDFDGVTFDGNSFIDFYSVNNTDKYVIQGRSLPFEESDNVPLGFRSSIDGNFTIAIDNADGLLESQKVYLEDKQTNILHDLTENDYTFNTAKGTFNDRFVLKYTNKTLGTGDFENSEDGVNIFVKNKIISLSSEKENIDKVLMYDISGKQLYQKLMISNLSLVIDNLKSAQQVLLVKVILENGHVITRKIIFR
ncbi:T9SS sorting signal type C domain-containing protein [Flavobacterium sp.]|uniref:DUF7507 domain-containing protein n=1 Tax=Flavobacterium sp. TaxID=239 RepID=UPI003267851C